MYYLNLLLVTLDLLSKSSNVIFYNELSVAAFYIYLCIGDGESIGNTVQHRRYCGGVILSIDTKFNT